MDLQKIINDLVSRLTGNTDLIAQFTKEPLAIVKKLLGIDLDPEQLAKVVKGVTAALGITAADAVKEGKGILDKIKGILG